MFDIATAADFYAMLVEDFDDFMAEPHSARRALHCATTAYHLWEWVWGDLISPNAELRQKFGVQNPSEFQNWIFNRSVWFRCLQPIVNGTKHFRLKYGQDFETMRVMAAPFALDQLHAGLDEGALDGPIRYVISEHPVGPKGEGYLLIDYGEGAGDFRFLTLASLLEVVLRFWRDFFREHFPTLPVPVSSHHEF
jgi:hypothetical protein